MATKRIDKVVTDEQQLTVLQQSVPISNPSTSMLIKKLLFEIYLYINMERHKEAQEKMETAQRLCKSSTNSLNE
jgi:hypothetical protein